MSKKLIEDYEFFKNNYFIEFDIYIMMIDYCVTEKLEDKELLKTSNDNHKIIKNRLSTKGSLTNKEMNKEMKTFLYGVLELKRNIADLENKHFNGTNVSDLFNSMR